MVDSNEQPKKVLLLMFAFISVYDKERKRWHSKNANVAQRKWLKHIRNPDGKHHNFISSKLFISWKMVRLCGRLYRAYEIHIHLRVMKSSGSSADLSQTLRCSLGLAVWKSMNCNHNCMSHFETLHLFYGHHSVVMAKWMNYYCRCCC